MFGHDDNQSNLNPGVNPTAGAAPEPVADGSLATVGGSDLSTSLPGAPSTVISPTIPPSNPGPSEPVAGASPSLGDNNEASSSSEDANLPPASDTAGSLPLSPPADDAPKSDEPPAVDSPSSDLPDLSSPTNSTPEDSSSPNPDLPALTSDSPTPSEPTSSASTSSPEPDGLLSIKQQALQQLSPLVPHLDQSPEEKFHTTMMMIQASDDQSQIQTAFEAAKAITDDKARAQALLDIINEINYFTQQPPADMQSTTVTTDSPKE